MTKFRPHNQLSHWLIVVVLFTMPALSWATQPKEMQYQDTEELRQLAEAFVAREMPSDIHSERLEATNLDPRLKLSRCEHQPDTFLSPGSRWDNKVTVGIRCSAPKPWSIYVPVNLYTSYPVVVTRRPIMRGQRVSKDDLEMRYSDNRSYQRGFKSIDDVVGRLARYSIPSGRVINVRMLDHAWVVKKGETVLIEAVSDTLRVKMQGVALENGLESQTILVENSSSGKQIDAIVTAEGLVKVNF